MCLTSDSPCWTGTLRDDLRLGRCGAMPPPGAKRPGLSVVRSLGSASLSQRGVIPTVKPAALEGERTTVLGQGAVVWFEVFVPGIVTAKPSKHGQEPRKPGGSRETFRPVSRGLAVGRLQSAAHAVARGIRPADGVRHSTLWRPGVGHAAVCTRNPSPRHRERRLSPSAGYSPCPWESCARCPKQ